MVASGVPIRNGANHAPEIALFALDVLEALDSLYIPHIKREKFKLRIGINTGKKNFYVLYICKMIYLSYVIRSIIRRKLYQRNTGFKGTNTVSKKLR